MDGCRETISVDASPLSRNRKHKDRLAAVPPSSKRGLISRGHRAGGSIAREAEAGEAEQHHRPGRRFEKARNAQNRDEPPSSAGPRPSRYMSGCVIGRFSRRTQQTDSPAVGRPISRLVLQVNVVHGDGSFVASWRRSGVARRSRSERASLRIGCPRRILSAPDGGHGRNVSPCPMPHCRYRSPFMNSRATPTF